MKLTKNTTRKQTHKTHKLIFSKSESVSNRETNSHNSQTHMTPNLETHKLTPKLTQKLTKIRCSLRRDIRERLVSVRDSIYFYELCELCELLFYATCEEKRSGPNILYKSRLRETHLIHKLTPYPEAV